MNKDKLEYFFSNSIAVRLLMSDNKGFIVSFLYKIYGDSLGISIKEDTMIDSLKEYIETLGDVLNYYKSKKAEDWLNEWTDNRKDGIELGGYLEKHKSTYNYGYVFSLSPQTVSVLRWLKELLDYEDGKYVAADSRFSTIFSNLSEMVRQSAENKEDKLKQLKLQKEKIEKDILDITTGRYDFERLDTHAFNERFNETTQMAKNLLSDFRQVERNIKDILKSLYERKLQAEATSEKLVAFVLDADTTWKATPQGRSFSAFYSFLRNIQKQEEFKQTINQVYGRIEDENPDLFLKDLIGGLNDQSYEVQRRISGVMQELEQSLVERANTEEKYIGQLIAEIKKIASENIENPIKDKKFLILEGFADINLPLERSLTIEVADIKKSKKYSFEHIEQPVSNDLIKSEFMGINPFEKKRLQQQLDQILQSQMRISLTDLLQIYPITNGLAELVAYIEIATENQNHVIDRTETDLILVTKPSTFEQIVSLPKILFCR